MTLSNKQIEIIARTVHAATGASHDCDCPHKPWNERSEESKRNMRWFVERAYVEVSNGIELEDSCLYIHNAFQIHWGNKSYVQGEKKTDNTHPLLIPFGQLPDSAKLNYKLLVSITKIMVEHYKLKEL